jgi:predicted ferric reductase
MRKEVGGPGPLSSLQRSRGPLTLAGLAALPAILYLASKPGPQFEDSFSSLNTLAVMLGVSGIATFALNLVLGGRFSVVDTYFGGLDRMYAVHRKNGEISYLLLLTHALLMLWSRATLSSEAAVDLITGGVGWAVTFGVIALTAMTVSIVLSVFVRLNHEIFVYVQRSFGAIFIVGALHAFMVPGAKAQSSLLTAYLAALAMAGLVAYAYRSLFDDVLVRRREYTVVKADRLDEAVTEIELAPVGTGVSHRPGQFVFVTFESAALRDLLSPFEIEARGRSALLTLRPGEISQQFHPFSITSPAGSENLRIVVKAVGDYTSAMRSLVQGASATVEGPYGGFTLGSAASSSLIWLAGGIGVTPFLSMARSLSGDEYEVDLYYATKTQRQAHFQREFEMISDRAHGFRVFQVVEETDGRITGEKVAQRSGGLAGKDIFICGPPGMIDSLKAQFLALGVPGHRIHYELFGFAR